MARLRFLTAAKTPNYFLSSDREDNNPRSMGQLAHAQGQAGASFLAQHPRFVFHPPPVHRSWMNQVEQWLGILQRKRLAIADFADKAALSENLQSYVTHWNEHAHRFNWSTKSAAGVMTKCQLAMAA
jgi:hypothetical protein